MTNWRVRFYRDGEDKPFSACLVWEKSAKDAETWARGFFKLPDSIKVAAEAA